MKKYLLILVIFTLACKDRSYSKQSTPNLKDQIGVKEKKQAKFNLVQKFQNKNPNTTFEDTLFLKSHFGYFEISPTGLLKINNLDSIQLNTKLIVKKAFIHKDSTDYYLYFTDTDYDAATSWIQKINATTLNSYYTKQIKGFNLGKPIIKSKKAYVSAIGFVGKIDLTTGEYDWKHNNLYDREKFSFNNFDSITFKKGQVEFISENYRSKKDDRVLVDNITGKIILIDK